MQPTAFVPIADTNRLYKLAVELSDEPSMPTLDIGAAGLARSLKASGRSVIGLLPANDRVDTLAFASHIGQALTLITGSRVLLLDPERRLVKNPNEGPFYVSRLGVRVLALSPHEPSPRGNKLATLRALLALAGPEDQRGDHFRHVLIDLSGCQWPGELGSSLAVLEGVVIVARASEVTEKELLSAARSVPEEQNLGVALTDR